jgi:NADPH-dependent 2,4-dienoyl-CoA reductase/sulfur reductase-like enzyme
VARRRVDHLLIGGGLAAANCARWLREEGADGSVLLVGREPDPPYNRPPLTKGYLQGKESREDALFRPDEWWGEQDVELMTRTSVMKLDSHERVATLSTRDEIEFGNALVATLSSDFAKGWHEQRRIDQVVVEHGTAPLDDLYFALKPGSSNLGAIDYEALVNGGEVFPKRQPGAYTLFRIGDAVASRNIHAAIYDGIRYAIRL